MFQEFKLLRLTDRQFDFAVTNSRIKVNAKIDLLTLFDSQLFK